MILFYNSYKVKSEFLSGFCLQGGRRLKGSIHEPAKGGRDENKVGGFIGIGMRGGVARASGGAGTTGAILGRGIRRLF